MSKRKVSSLRTEGDKMMMARATALFNATPTEQRSNKIMMAEEPYINAQIVVAHTTKKEKSRILSGRD